MCTSLPRASPDEVELHPEATVVLAPHGRGRSAALLGSVTEELLERIFSDRCSWSESVLPLAAAWGIEFGGEPWIVEVADPDAIVSADVSDSAYPARLARKLARSSGHPVQFEVLVRPPNLHH